MRPRLHPLLVALLAAACASAPGASTAVPSTPAPTASAIASPTSTTSTTLTPAPSAPATAPYAPPTIAPSPLVAPKAVIIVGPTDELTDTLLVQAETMAQRAEAAGLDVQRVFFPHATWDNVLAQIEGASLVAYFGHGYGWPSNTAELTESRQDGMGLNSYDGSSVGEVKYYGANLIREAIR